MMIWGDGNGWMMGPGWIIMILFWVLIVLGIIALVRWLGSGGGNHRHESRPTPVEILKERYARGEINRDEYEQKRLDLEK